MFLGGGVARRRFFFLKQKKGSEVLRYLIALQSWDIVFAGYRLALPGFLPGAVNSVQIGNPSAFAPDFLRLGVAA